MRGISSVIARWDTTRADSAAAFIESDATRESVALKRLRGISAMRAPDSGAMPGDDIHDQGFCCLTGWASGARWRCPAAAVDHGAALRHSLHSRITLCKLEVA